MKVLLWRKMEKLGNRGDVVDVKDGYARNYLFPYKYASPTNVRYVKELEIEKKRLVKVELREKDDAMKLIEVFEKTACTLEVPASKEGSLYGSVTPEMVAAALKKEGVEIAPKMLTIKDHIKELGVYPVTAKLHPEVSVDFRIWVVEGSLEE